MTPKRKPDSFTEALSELKQALEQLGRAVHEAVQPLQKLSHLLWRIRRMERRAKRRALSRQRIRETRSRYKPLASEDEVL